MRREDHADSEVVPHAAGFGEHGLFMIINADDDTVAVVSDAMLFATARSREAILGKPWTTGFPGAANASVKAAYRASIARIGRTGRADAMPVQRFPLRVIADGDACIQPRYLSPSNTPVFAADNRLAQIIHRLHDVTDLLGDLEDRAPPSIGGPTFAQALALQSTEAGVVQRTLELRDATEKLFENESMLAVASRLARIGAWSIDRVTGLVVWSAQLREMFGIARIVPASVGAMFERCRPADRRRLAAAYARCIVGGTPFDFEVEAMTTNNSVLTVRAIGTAEQDATGQVTRIHGGIQDVTEERLIARRLQESEQRLSFALEASDIGEWSLEADSDRFRRSARYDRIFGYPEGVENWTLETWISCVHPDDRERAQQHIRNAACGDGIIDLEHRIVWPDGSVHWLWKRGRATRTVSGTIAHAAGIVIDITRRRQAEEQLRLLEVCVAHTNDVILITDTATPDDPGQRIVFVNDAFARLTGYTRAEVIGQSPRMFQGPKSSRAEIERIHAAIGRREPVRAELLNYGKDGSAYCLEMDIVPVFERGGVQTHFVAVERDVTERYAVTQKLAEQAALIDEASDAIIVCSLTGTIRFWSRGAERIFGWTALEAVGAELQALLPTDTTRFEATLAATIAEGHLSYETTRPDRGSQMLQIEERWSIVRTPGGAAKSTLAIMTDVTAPRLLARQLQQAQRLEAIGQLTGGVAHDFNNLLTVILGNAEVLTRTLQDDPEQRLLAEQARHAAQRGAELTHRLLAFARRQELQPVTVDLNEMVVETHALVARTIGEDIQVTLALAAHLPTVLVDPSELQNAIVNVCLNARDAMPNGGTIVIETANAAFDSARDVWSRTTQPGAGALIVISDEGTGIAPDVLARVFDPFFTTKGVGKGTGLGLSMVYGFIRQSGGHVVINSSLGGGTSLTMFLRASEDAPAERDDADAAVVVPGGSEHILVVEDDELVRHYVESQLQVLGYSITTAIDGAAALAWLARGEPCDLLFTDVVMPNGVNGRELATLAAGLRPGLRVLFTSGYAHSALGADGHVEPGLQLLTKPYRRLDLAFMVRKVLAMPCDEAL